MNRRRLLTAAATGVLLTALGIGSAAANPPQGGITGPGEGATVGDATIHGSFTHDGGFESFSFAITETGEGDPIADPNVTAGCNQGPVTCSGDTASFSWSPRLSYNGVYKVDVRATADHLIATGPSVTNASRTFSLEAPPAPPKKVEAHVASDTRVVTVTWRPNTEPDLLHYVVTRVVDGGAAARFDVPKSDSATMSFVDPASADKGGTYVYGVEAVRKGASGSAVVLSQFVPAGPLAVSEPPPPPTTTTEAGAPGEEAPAPTSTSVVGTTPGTSPAATRSPAPVVRGGTADLSGFAALRARATTPPATRPMAADPGYAETLPYDASRSTAAPAGQDDLPGTEGQAALPVSRSSGDSSGDRRALLVPMAAGLILFVGALQMRWVASRGVEPLEAL